MNKKKVVCILAVITAIALILGVQKIYTGYDKKNNYYYSESYSSLDKNAYVGGDAYNYIINGNYFTGYMVQGMGYLLIATIAGVSALVLNIDLTWEENKKEQLPEL